MVKPCGSPHACVPSAGGVSPTQVAASGRSAHSLPDGAPEAAWRRGVGVLGHLVVRAHFITLW